jgi:hypothetical protein
MTLFQLATFAQPQLQGGRLSLIPLWTEAASAVIIKAAWAGLTTPFYLLSTSEDGHTRSYTMAIFTSERVHRKCLDVLRPQSPSRGPQHSGLQPGCGCQSSVQSRQW